MAVRRAVRGPGKALLALTLLCSAKWSLPGPAFYCERHTDWLGRETTRWHFPEVEHATHFISGIGEAITGLWQRGSSELDDRERQRRSDERQAKRLERMQQAEHAQREKDREMQEREARAQRKQERFMAVVVVTGVGTTVVGTTAIHAWNMHKERQRQEDEQRMQEKDEQRMQEEDRREAAKALRRQEQEAEEERKKERAQRHKDEMTFCVFIVWSCAAAFLLDKQDDRAVASTTTAGRWPARNERQPSSEQGSQARQPSPLLFDIYTDGGEEGDAREDQPMLAIENGPATRGGGGEEPARGPQEQRQRPQRPRQKSHRSRSRRVEWRNRLPDTGSDVASNSL